ILHDLQVLPRRQLSKNVRDDDQQHGERDKAVHHFVAHRFAKAVDRNPAERLHPAGRALCSTVSTKMSSSVSRSGLSDTRRPPSATRSAKSCSGGVSSGSSSANRPPPIGEARVILALCFASTSSFKSAATSSQPRTRNASISLSRPLATNWP